MIDTERMTEGAELAKELRGSESGGIPWSVILDGNGEAKVTSDGPKGNIGCPVQPHEIDHFLAMIDKTRRHMSDDDRAIFEREMRAFGAAIGESRKNAPGKGAFTEASHMVKAGQFKNAVSALKRAVDDGLPAQSIIPAASLRPLREDPDRRLELFELIKNNVNGNAIQLIDQNEPGRRIRLEGQVVDMESGAPLAGALMQLFHTDAGGEYRPGMNAGGGAGNPRLFGYLRTDAEGHFRVDTIMPERYPNSSVPRHVHYRVWAEGYPLFESECFFDADPLLNDEARKTAPDRNFPIVKLEQNDDHRQIGTLIVRMPRN